MKLSASTIKALWAEFADCPINDHEEILEPFCGWPVFTDREEIWRWFDEQYALYGGVHALMFPSERKEEPIWSEYLEAVDTVCGMCCYDTERALEGDDSQCAACMVRKTCDIAYEEMGRN